MTYDIPLHPYYLANEPVSASDTTEPHGTDIFSMFMGEQLIFLEGVISGLNEQIKERRDLNIRIKETLSEEWFLAKGKLYELDIWPLGGSKSIDQRRQTIEKGLALLDTEMRREDIGQFQDIGLLRRDLREWEEKYQKLQRRIQIIDLNL